MANCDQSELEARLWLCHQLLTDAVSVIDPEEYPVIFAAITEELQSCDVADFCPAPRAHPDTLPHSVVSDGDTVACRDCARSEVVGSLAATRLWEHTPEDRRSVIIRTEAV